MAAAPHLSRNRSRSARREPTCAYSCPGRADILAELGGHERGSFLQSIAALGARGRTTGTDPTPSTGTFPTGRSASTTCTSPGTSREGDCLCWKRQQQQQQQQRVQYHCGGDWGRRRGVRAAHTHDLWAHKKVEFEYRSHAGVCKTALKKTQLETAAKAQLTKMSNAKDQCSCWTYTGWGGWYGEVKFMEIDDGDIISGTCYDPACNAT
ncbi:hypothetical protein BO82DRAFT_399612 [Aspergillus uvarum CBS 121591]|uniref:Uncharacterized protein n=1 Tax=Aspergillus uvarum CBS 121591 TaxID=1448315 RepID=A0A319D8P5_9EURO|nr:hypothetical protein BO82DRAFT_399612 [Aspergillus uvarum CBS 121591]PYH84368.1 hypothetical protein BO82DRAFT_399612 [Aspergillus uvarum CBS 121591]